MKFMIIAPKLTHKSSRNYYFPVGLAYVSAALKRADFDVECVNLNHVDEWEGTLRETCLNSRPDVVCLGGLSADYKCIRDTLHFVKQILPGVTTVVGGGMISSEPEVMMAGLGADIGVIGEGEVTMVEIAEALEKGEPARDIPGTIVPEPMGGFHRGPAREVVKNPDELPIPDYEGFEYDVYLDCMLPNDSFFTTLFDKPRYASIVSSRSCPYLCSFCFHPLGGKFRQRSLDSLFKEIDFVVEQYKVTCIVLMDELFATKTNRKRVREFCERIKKRNIPFFISLRVDVVDEELMAMLSDAGCLYIGYGIESAHPDVLKSMNKHITVEQIETALDLTQKYNVGLQGNLLFCDAGETMDTARHSLNWWKEHKHYQLGLSELFTFPGSPLYKQAVKKGLIKDRLAYIEEADFRLNNTDMSQEDYDTIIKEMVDLAVFSFEVPGTVLNASFTNTNKAGQGLFDVTSTCPHCDSSTHYKNLHHVATNPTSDLRIKVVCRSCRRRYDLPSIRELFITISLKYTQPGRFALYGAGGRTVELLERLPELKEQVGFIYDSNPEKEGTDLAGIPVKAYPGNIPSVKDSVDAIGICSIYENEIFDDIHTIGKYGVLVTKLPYDLTLEVEESHA